MLPPRYVQNFPVGAFFLAKLEKQLVVFKGDNRPILVAGAKESDLPLGFDWTENDLLFVL